MFVPVIAYDPDLFADFVFVMSQQEVSTASQPLKRITNEQQSAFRFEQTADVASAAVATYRWSVITRQQVSQTLDQIVFVGALLTQIQSKFTARTFTSNLAAPRVDVPMVSGNFVTDQTLEPLFDNIVFRVTVGALDLSDTKANNKSVAPVVS